MVSSMNRMRMKLVIRVKTMVIKKLDFNQNKTLTMKRNLNSLKLLYVRFLMITKTKNLLKLMRYLLLSVDNLVYLDHWEIMESILCRLDRVISRRRSKSHLGVDNR